MMMLYQVVNVYMAKAPSGTDVAKWAGDGAVWFKVYQISAVTNGGTSITFPAQSMSSYIHHARLSAILTYSIQTSRLSNSPSLRTPPAASAFPTLIGPPCRTHFHDRYLVRVEAIALHVASTFGGAQNYVIYSR
jgi:hypothetical protein